ncbi:MAG: tRNA (adenosine(37)-N6)-threonylcarbamoyltransferase complex ATPase subunit type 1 TsaE [Desulfovibrio sp.]|nr:tRNA (adenosine(37)-N6)-threonylcarbamoyltransferase complex ATPase subunit type 1 TsaE [Desulfovibrio sp.]
MATLTLCDELATQHFGDILARAVTQHGPTALLLRGSLGSGKTTLTRALVNALPGGDAAEPSSPTFTLCHSYPTTPPILHCDLYRCPGYPPEEVLDALDNTDILTVVEWAEYLPAAFLPQDYLDIELQACDEQRLLTLHPCGVVATALQHLLLQKWFTRNTQTDFCQNPQKAY